MDKILTASNCTRTIYFDKDKNKFAESIIVRPLIRCRDCRFSPDDGQTCERDGDEFNVTLVRPDGFCAWGESAWVTCKCGEDIEKFDRIQICPSCGRVVFA